MTESGAAQSVDTLRCLISQASPSGSERNSPGGTTVEGLLVLERHAVRAALTEAVLAAYAKAQRLG